MKDIKTKLGLIIKKYRKSQNLTQAELANLIGVDPKYISRIETGSSYPSLAIVEKIFSILNIDFLSLFSKENSSDRNAVITKINRNLKVLNCEQLKIIETLTECLIQKY